MPVPDAGATYIGFADAIHIPELYRDQPARLIADGLYRVADLPPHAVDMFTPICLPQESSRLDNGATILGYYAPGNPAPVNGKAWTIYLLWKGASGTPTQAYQIFNHLIDDKGDRHAQNDIPALDSALWRDSDVIVSRVTLAPAGLNMPQALALRVGMYTMPGFKNANVLDSAGNPAGQWVTIPLCETF
jgi:hypothetical protein